MQKEAEEAANLAMEIIKERHSIKSRPDVVPCYIKNRPVPQAQIADPRPKIGPLSITGTYENVDQENPEDCGQYTTLQNPNKQEDLYLDLGQVNQHQPAVIEEQYLDLDEAKCEYMKSIEMIEPDPDI